MLNAFAYRSTDPSKLEQVDDPVGPDNKIELIQRWIHEASPNKPAVAAWGIRIAERKKLRFRLEELNRLRLDCFTRTKDGHPNHPLYLENGLKPKPWNY